MQLWSDRGPQGYGCRAHGAGARRLVEYDGITLAAKIPRATADDDALKEPGEEAIEP